MARGTTLVKLLDYLRSECGVSQNPAHNPQVRDQQIISLQRTQEMLWGDFAWPHLRVDRVVELQAGQRYYDMPTDIDIDRIERIEVRFNSAYCELKWGIEACHYAVFDSDLDVRSSPAQRVRIVEDEQLEIWPIPDVDADPDTLEGRVKITGIRQLRPLVADDDRADLDDRLIVLYAAAEWLARNGAKDAQVKQDKANRHYLKIRGGLMPRRRFGMLGVGQPEPRRRHPYVAIYRAPGGS